MDSLAPGLPRLSKPFRQSDLVECIARARAAAKERPQAEVTTG